MGSWLEYAIFSIFPSCLFCLSPLLGDVQLRELRACQPPKQQRYRIVSIVLAGTNCLNDRTCSAEAPHDSTVVLFREDGGCLLIKVTS